MNDLSDRYMRTDKQIKIDQDIARLEKKLGTVYGNGIVGLKSTHSRTGGKTKR